ncbi:MAG: hypothetical protein Q8L60_06415 [Gammaproteobacteria bacterium]|nr:hypothetical protein [Gammaproteobacteria bacterium]MDP2142066.1 hypothetical protein [Gammaproteobacteria bacterium]MDP2348355.1 hypothetical protein [Gammaproteobacteria bacterium]
MRALAEFAMAGRRQAVQAAMLLGVLPLVNFLSAPVVALVFLRYGRNEGLIVLAWAVLPALGWAVAGDMIPLLLLMGISVLAMVLRTSGSWEVTVLSGIGVGMGAQLGMLLQPELLQVLQQQIELMLNTPEMQVQMAPLEPEQLQQMLRIFFGTMLMFLSLVLLMMARNWQAKLYNPGGFRDEFHQLRLSWKSSAALLLMFVLAGLGVPLLQQLSLFFVMPLLFAGVALVHGMVGLKKWPGAVLVVFYASLLSPVVTQIVVFAAIADSWYDFRSRLRPKQGSQGGSDGSQDGL